MTIREIKRMFKNSSLLEQDSQKLYLLAKTTGEVDRIPSPDEIIEYRDYSDDSGYQIVAMSDFFVAVNIWDFTDDEPECEFCIYEDGCLVTVSTDNSHEFVDEYEIVYGAQR